MSAKLRTAILISGRGSNMVSLVSAARADGYPAEIVGVISNRPDAPGLGWARDHGLAGIAIDHRAYPVREAFENDLQSALIDMKADLVALAGFMRLMTPGFVDTWRDRMINIHPSLLPSFTGLDTHQRAIDAGVKFAGCTVHFVRPEMDVGPIIAQAAVPVMPRDTAPTLAARVLAAEHKLYPFALSLVASGIATVNGEIVEFSQELDYPDAVLAPGSPPTVFPK